MENLSVFQTDTGVLDRLDSVPVPRYVHQGSLVRLSACIVEVSNAGEDSATGADAAFDPGRALGAVYIGWVRFLSRAC